jgi:hypothetical protein
LLFFGRLKDKSENARAYDKDRHKNCYLHLNGSSGCISIPR